MELYPIVILCGGKGTRLGEKTAHCPKSLVPIAGEPFIVHQLRLLERAGFRNVFLLVQHLGYQFLEVGLEDRFPSLHLRFIFEGDEPLGTAGAVRQALRYLAPCLFTIYGDSYLECDYAALQTQFRHSLKSGLLTRYNGQDYGVSVFAQGAFRGTERTIPEVHQGLAHRFGGTTVEMSDPWLEMGSPAGFAQLECHLLQKGIAPVPTS